MIIDGKTIAQDILTRVTSEVNELKKQGVSPTLAVVLVGDDPASLAYIKQKQKAADTAGIILQLNHLEKATIDDLQELIRICNDDSSIHGLIVQRPLPTSLGDVSTILDSVLPDKDVDGFLPNSPFEVPVAEAVGEILKRVKSQVSDISLEKLKETEFIQWLQEQSIVVIGRGSTAGAPILHYFEKLHCAASQIHSQTTNPNSILKDASVIVSCVGKERVVSKYAIKKGAILISVGIWRDTTGKLRGDYEEADIADIAFAYTPTPGGVGPVNVACLMQNVVKACKMG